MASKMTIEERIAHFLRMAEDGGATQAERDSAAEQAERLMIKHGIEETMLNREAGLPKNEPIVTKSTFFGGAYSGARMMMGFSIISALKLKGYHMSKVYGVDPISNKRVYGEQFTVVGFESNVEEAMRLVRSLDLQAAIAARAYGKNELSYLYDPQEKVARKRAFIESFGRGAGTRIRETRRKVVEEVAEYHAGTALVLVNREKEVDDYYSTLSLRKGRSRIQRSSSAGYAAGYNANTGGNSLGAGRARISR